jgi:AcrR family transcriptional regulator
VRSVIRGLDSVTVDCNEFSVDLPEAHVKTTRPYASRTRTDRARATRAAVVAAARTLLLRDGYAATTVAAVAAEAGVSVETVYKGFGGKPGIVRAVWEQALEGLGREPAERRSDRLQATETDARRLVRGWAELTVEVAPRVAPVLLLVRAAASVDPDMAALRSELDDSRLERMTDNARTLADGGHLRAGVTAARAGGLLWTYTSPELFEMLVLTRGWDVREYARFVEESLVAALLRVP